MVSTKFKKDEMSDTTSSLAASTNNKENKQNFKAVELRVKVAVKK